MTELLYNELTYAVIGAAMEVHRVLGPGFLEAVYQSALAHELKLRAFSFQEQVHLPVCYKGILAGDYIADFTVEDKLILELKAISMLNASHKAQAMHYLTATGFRLALLLNFGTVSLQHQRVIR
jgi:GxxExxY protein